MRASSVLLTASATAVLVAVPLGAHAATPTEEFLDRRTFDGFPTRTTASMHIDGATAGPLGGYLDVTFTAADGSLPTGSNACEPVTVDATLTVSPGETLSASIAGEACTSFYGSTISVNAFFDKDDVTYEGTVHRKAKVVGDGLIAAGDMGFLGAQASFGAMVKWY